FRSRLTTLWVTAVSRRHTRGQAARTPPAQPDPRRTLGARRAGLLFRICPDSTDRVPTPGARQPPCRRVGRFARVARMAPPSRSAAGGERARQRSPPPFARVLCALPRRWLHRGEVHLEQPDDELLVRRIVDVDLGTHIDRKSVVEGTRVEL